MNARIANRMRAAVGAAMVAATLLASCTTFIQPVRCEGGDYRCNEQSDVKFCEYQAVRVEGADCAAMGLAASKNFCVVTHTACVDTAYEVKARTCRVIQYRPLREWRECSPGTPTFARERGPTLAM
jgi:hypothetical protein